VRWYLGVLFKRHRSRLALICFAAVVFYGIRARMAAARDRSSIVDPRAALRAAVDAETADIARAAANARTKSVAMNGNQRLQWVRQCAHPPKCEPWLVDAIVDGAPPEAQRQTLRVSFAALTEDVASTATDDELATAAASTIAGIIARPGMGMALLGEMPVTTLADASKNPAHARGKTLKVTGRILEIRSRDGLIEGTLATEGKTIVQFVTAIGVKGLRAGSSVAYGGVFLRRNMDARATSPSVPVLVVVGAFDTPQNR
jgi:hypothetical protein